MRSFSFLSHPKGLSRKYSYTGSAPARSSRRFEANSSEMRRVFDRYDTNKDGRISLAEYRAVVRVTGGPRLVDEGTVRRMFEVADKDGDGYIDFEEFQGVNAGVRMADIRGAFRVFDIDGDGRISAEEVAEVMNRIGGFDGCGLEDCRRMLKAVDKDGDGLVDMDEFTCMMTRTMKLVF